MPGSLLVPAVRTLLPYDMLGDYLDVTEPMSVCVLGVP